HELNSMVYFLGFGSLALSQVIKLLQWFLCYHRGMQRLALVSLCILAIAAPSFSSAQAPLNQLSNTSVSITLDPASPEPFEEVTATLDNFVSSLYGSKITWYLDGTDITTPGDQTKATFTTGALGN